MEETRNERLNSFSPYTVLGDILKNWLGILLITASVGMAAHLVQVRSYEPLYSCRTTMVLSTKGVNNNVYQNLSAASSTAEVFTRLIGSRAMQQLVAKDIGLDHFEGTASASNVADTNMLTVTVSAASPRICFLEMKSILNNYERLSRNLLGDIMLTVLEEPKAPEEVTNPLRTLPLTLTAMGAAFMLLLLCLAGASVLRDTIRSPGDVELKLDADLLGAIPHEKKNRGIRLPIKRAAKSGILITDPAVSFRYVEGIRKLESRIRTLMQERGGKTLLIASVLENEGKSTTAANIALALAEEGARVLLVDGDLRKPSLYKVLNLREQEFLSLSEYLEKGGDPSMMPVTVPGSRLQCILSRISTSKLSDSFPAEAVAFLLSFYRDQMDYIIIDTPPMQMAADTEELAGICDACLLVVRQHMVEAGDLNEAIDALNRRRNRLIGVAFNDEYEGGSGAYGYLYGESYGYDTYGGHYDKK